MNGWIGVTEWCIAREDRRKGLLKLEALSKIRLPASQGLPSERRAGPSASDSPFVATGLADALVEQGRNELVTVEAKIMGSRKWRDMFDLHYPLKIGPLWGVQQRHMIHCEQIGWLDGLSLSAAAWHLVARDKWIGWSPMERIRNLLSGL